MTKRGFTLIELMVAIAIFGVVIIAASNLLLEVIKNSVRSSLQNELRQNAQKVLMEIGQTVRNGGCVVNESGVLAVYSDKACLSNPVRFSSSIDPSDYSIKKDGASLTSPKVAPCMPNPSNACDSSCTQGFSYIITGTTSVSVTLNLMQKPGATRSEYCASVTLSDSFATRN